MCPARFARGGRCTSLLTCLAKPQNKNLSLFTCFHLKTNKQKKTLCHKNSDLPNTFLSSMRLRSVGAQNRFLASGQRGHSCPCGMGMGRCPCSPGMGRMGWPPNIPGSAWFWELKNPDWHYGRAHVSQEQRLGTVDGMGIFLQAPPGGSSCRRHRFWSGTRAPDS